ncbi:MAG TPA: helix-turn-helix transcriptional regulator [Actinomycetales bacterium]
MATDRMQEPTFLILTALAAGSRHGYGLIKDVEQLSRGDVQLRVGTLYGALDRLAGEGLVEVESEEVVDSRLRRNYRLTPQGAERLEAEALRSRRQAEAALRRLRAARPARGGLA